MEWRHIQKDNFKSLTKLINFLELDSTKRSKIAQKSTFPINVPKRIANKIAKNSLTDPIFLQFIPLAKENDLTQGFCKDPVSDTLFQQSARLLHKYPGRALLLCTSACAMHCRFCFRQNYPYEKTKSLFTKELNTIAKDSSIYEIILSGGDPLSLSDEALFSLVKSLETISHLKLLRFHTRFLIGIPERVTKTFLSILKQTGLQTIFVIHINHIKELDSDIITALKKIKDLGIPVLSQTVLLKGVNDTVEALRSLFLKLVQEGMIPYYLHQLDQLQGGAHFKVDPFKGIELIKELRNTLPGYAVPTFVKEIPFEKSKTPLHTI